MKPESMKTGHQPESEEIWNESTGPNWEGHMVYREMAAVPFQIIDPVDEFARNVSQVEDMQARLRFMMREIRQMMKA